MSPAVACFVGTEKIPDLFLSRLPHSSNCSALLHITKPTGKFSQVHWLAGKPGRCFSCVSWVMLGHFRPGASAGLRLNKTRAVLGDFCCCSSPDPHVCLGSSPGTDEAGGARVSGYHSLPQGKEGRKKRQFWFWGKGGGSPGEGGDRKGGGPWVEAEGETDPAQSSKWLPAACL